MSKNLSKGIGVLGLFLGLTFLFLSCTGREKTKEDKPPRAPTCLSASLDYAGSLIQIKISWAESDKVDEFVIQRSYQDQTNYTSIGFAGNNEIEYLDYMSLDPGTTYWYRVAAYNGVGFSDYCDPVSATTLPQAPINLSASPVSLTQIKVSWTDAWPGDSDGFKIERSIHDQLSYQEVGQVGKGVTEYDDQGLEPGTIYWYRVRAYNQGGLSDYSEPTSSTTIFDAYEMCVNKTSNFPCLPYALCSKNVDGASYLDIPASEVFTCLNLQLTVPATMTISFAYKASARTCYDQAYLEVIMAGVQSGIFSFDCNASGNSTISIVIANGQTIDDISFGLFSGDWGSSVSIESITFAP